MGRTLHTRCFAHRPAVDTLTVVSTDRSNPPDDEFSLSPLVRPEANFVGAGTTLQRQSFDPVQYAELTLPRYSFGELILWVSLVSLALSCQPLLPPQVFAGICGFASLIWLILMAKLQPDTRVFFVIWWALLAIYAIACPIAICNG